MNTQILIDLTEPTMPSLEEVGGKAFNLSRLHQIGLPVPAAVAIPASMHCELSNAELEYLSNQILKHRVIASGDRFAVRSSGIGEDGELNSYAGIFESYLDISKEDIFAAVLRVWDSLQNPRSAMYARERGVSVTSMGVVIQHMVPADYAGVAFSVSPIERDNRIALIEVVKGNGESLVSGKRTPATLRVNKLTGAVRVAQAGEDNLDNLLLEDLAQQVIALVEQIELAYGIAVDVEWAVSKGEVYILQARPITS